MPFAGLLDNVRHNLPKAGEGVLTLSAEEIEAVAAERWYYQIELEGGVQTKGRPRANAAVFREFLRRIDLNGKTCLDIGTQEFVAPVVLLRQGAAAVTAYDRLALATRYEAVKQSYSVDFDYISGIPVRELKETLAAQGKRTVFDIVNFSGVLYHMVDPLTGLAIARSFLRLGGLMVIETSVKRSPEFVMEFNNAGRIYRGSNYFQVSIGTLDYWIRMLRMVPLECVSWGGGDICRFLVICRAAADVQPETNDTWMRKQFIRLDFQPYGLTYDELDSNEPAVAYRPLENAKRIFRPGDKLLDLYATAAKTPRFRANEALQALKLEHQF